MSVENALEYFRLLEEDKEFAAAISNAADDKEEQTRLINERGLEFTKEEFKQALTECFEKLNSESKSKLEDTDLDSINAAGVLGEWFGKAVGLVPAAGHAAPKFALRTLHNLVDGKSLEESFKSAGDSVKETFNKDMKDYSDFFKKKIPF